MILSEELITMSEFIQVSTTFDKRRDAEDVVRSLIEKRLAACVQICGPVTSVYRWQGNVEAAEEWVCVIKTRRDLYPQLESEIQSVHPYDEPEIIAVPIVQGSDGYLNWVLSETQQS
jgi:periplasmic divalent cation tolerance protein